MNLFDEEVWVSAALRRLDIPRNGDRVAPYHAAGKVRDAHAVARDLDDLALFDDDDPPRMPQDGGDIRGEEVLAVTQPGNQRTRLARADDTIGMLTTDHRDGIRAGDPPQRRAHGGDEVAARGERVLDQVREHLSIRLGAEGVAARRQLVTQRGIVLNDAVMHHRQVLAAIRVGMRVVVIGAPMRRPACMADAYAAVWFRDGHRRAQIPQLAGGLAHLHLTTR